MTTRGLSLADVAFCAGFADQAHFARGARKRWLLSPSQFKVLLGEETNPLPADAR
jgi:transcriptional regulator GlxA family with amidase domain